MYKCCVDWQRSQKKTKKRADVSVLTREWKNCPYPCVIVVPFKHVWSNRGDPHKHQLTGRAARSLSVTCVTVKISRVGSAADADSWIVSGKNKNAKATKKHCSQNENRLNLQESQLELNCESGITLYIKKKKKENDLALSPLVVFSLCFNLWSGLRNQICCRCFIFSVPVNCLAKNKTDRKKTLKGLCICLIHLEFYFLMT